MITRNCELLNSFKLQEDLHAAQIRLTEQQDEIKRLRTELDFRPTDPDKRILELQEEVSGLKLIAGQLYLLFKRLPSLTFVQRIMKGIFANLAGKSAKTSKRNGP